MNKRYQFLLDSEYRKLIFAFEESKKIFQNDKNKNNLPSCKKKIKRIKKMVIKYKKF